MDTYLVLSKFVQLLGGGEIPRRAGAWLRRQVFDQGYRRFKSAALRQRYFVTQECARHFLQRLRRVPALERLNVLRTFRSLDWEGKLAFVQRASN